MTSYVASFDASTSAVSGRADLSASTFFDDPNFLRSVLESSSDCIDVMDLEGTLQFVNASGLASMELERFQELAGKAWLDFWHGDAEEAAKEALEQARKGNLGQFTGFCPTAKGTPKWWDVRVTPIRSRSGRIERLLAVSRDITEARLALKALTVSEMRFHLALKASNMVGAWDWDVPNDRIYSDARCATLFSVDVAQAAAGAPLSTYVAGVHPLDRSRLNQNIQEALRAKGEFNAEFRIQPGGEVRWVDARGRAIGDETGPAVRFLGVVVDITERKKMERRRAALLELGDRLRELQNAAEIAGAAAEILGRTFELSRAGYGEIDDQGESILIEQDWAAPGVESIAGRHSLSEYGNVLDDLRRGIAVVVADVTKDPRTAANAETFLRLGIRALLNVPVLENGKLTALVFLHDDSRRVWPDDKVAFIRDVADRTRAAVERRRSQKALMESEANLRRIADALPILISFIDRDQIFRFANKHYEHWFGVDHDELIGKSVEELLGPEVYANRKPYLDRALAGEEIIVEVFTNKPDGGRREAELYLIPKRDPNGIVEGLYTCSIDISDRKAVEERQRLLMEELSHRMKNMLAMVQSIATQTLRDGASLTEARDTFRDRLYALSQAHDILLRESWTSTSLHKLVTNVTAPHGGPERFRISGDDVKIPAKSALALTLALHELSTNAVKYGALSCPEGHVDISWKASVSPRRLEFRWEEKDGPPVGSPKRKGFGTRMIERVLGGQMPGQVSLTFAPSGVVCSIKALLHEDSKAS